MSESYERLAAWREAINLDLMNAGIHLVLSSTMRTDARTEVIRSLRKQPWYHSADSAAYFAPAEIRYMGELLERFAEKYGDEPEHFRAVALALAMSIPCAEEGMFVGNQRRVFMKRLQKEAQNDLYLFAALYLLEPSQQNGIESQFLTRQHTDAAALLFALTILPSDAFSQLRTQFIRLLGKGRTLPVHGNCGLYAALLRKGGETIRACRQKDNALLKALLTLCDGYVRSDSRPDSVLREQGYSRQEICYLNAALLWEPNLPLNFHTNSIPAEKLAVELVTAALNAREQQPSTVMDFVAHLLLKYSKFSIKIEGNNGIWQAIEPLLHPDCPETVAWMSSHINEKFQYQFDVLDARWDVLASLVDKECYHELFRMQFVRTNPSDVGTVTKMLSRYQALTGNTYTDVFKAYTWAEVLPFRVLIDAGVLDLADYFTAHENEPGDDYNHYSCMHYILEYAASVSTRKAYAFWVWFFSSHSVRDYSRYFGKRKTFDEAFIHSESYSYSRCYGMKIDVFREFLSSDEQRMLYEWADESFFCFHPDKYVSFQTQALQDKYVRTLFSHEELRQTFDALLASEPQSVSDQLKNLYYTEEEKKREADARAERRAQEALAAAAKTRKELEERIEKDFDGTFRSAWKLADHTWRDQELMAELLLPVVVKQYDNCAHCLVRKEIIALVQLCSFFLKHKPDFFPVFKTIIEQLEEVVPDDSCCAATVCSEQT